MAELKSCPFCGAEAKPMGEILRTQNSGEWKHSYNGCILSGFAIRENKIEAWNRRIIMSCNCNKIENLRIKKMFPDAIEPKRGTDGSAGYDLFACDATLILPGKSCMITTGIAMEIPNGYVGLVFARSGLATKQGLRPANCVGVIDSDYRGEIKVCLYNDSYDVREVNFGDRIAQIVIVPYIYPNLEVVENLSDTERGDGGFGSTGK